MCRGHSAFCCLEPRPRGCALTAPEKGLCLPAPVSSCGPPHPDQRGAATWPSALAEDYWPDTWLSPWQEEAGRLSSESWVWADQLWLRDPSSCSQFSTSRSTRGHSLENKRAAAVYILDQLASNIFWHQLFHYRIQDQYFFSYWLKGSSSVLVLCVYSELTATG